MADKNNDAWKKLYEEYEKRPVCLIMHSAEEKEGKLLLEDKAALRDDLSN